MSETPVVVAWGAGRNSTAMLIGAVERGERVDAITFSNTGGEKPETYRHIWEFSEWLVANGMPAPRILRAGPFTVGGRAKRPQSRRNIGETYATLEEECLTLGTLPSIVYGQSKCSAKWKREVQESWAAKRFPRGGYVQWIGFSAEEAHRAERGERAATERAATGGGALRFPLIEWDWGQEECERAIQRAGLPMPPKSACFFCPSSKKSEVLSLAKNWPDLFARAVQIERVGMQDARTIKGLGRHWSWEQLAKADEAQYRLFDDPPQMPCMCDDGDAT